MNVEIIGVDELKRRLAKLSDPDWNELWHKQGQDMKKRSDSVAPYKTGALRRSATYSNAEFGYTVDYADDVNYGHRTSNGGFVPGRHFLEEIVRAQANIYGNDVLKKLKEDK